jgi:WD40 repeat protein
LSIALLSRALTRALHRLRCTEVRTWHLGERKCLWNVKGHDGFVEGIASDDKGRNFLSCGVDKTVKLWALKPNLDDEEGISVPFLETIAALANK